MRALVQPLRVSGPTQTGGNKKKKEFSLVGCTWIGSSSTSGRNMKTYFSAMMGSEWGLPWASCFFRSLGLFLIMSLDIAWRLGGFGELPGLDLGVPLGGVPVGLGASLTLSPALKDFDLCLPLGGKDINVLLRRMFEVHRMSDLRVMHY